MSGKLWLKKRKRFKKQENSYYFRLKEQIQPKKAMIYLAAFIMDSLNENY